MDGRINAWMRSFIHTSRHECIHGPCMNVPVYRYMHKYMDVCLYVCIDGLSITKNCTYVQLYGCIHGMMYGCMYR